jgi:hypothetical protein
VLERKTNREHRTPVAPHRIRTKHQIPSAPYPKDTTKGRARPRCNQTLQRRAITRDSGRLDWTKEGNRRGFSGTSSLRTATASWAPVMLTKVSIASCGGIAMAGELGGSAAPWRWKDRGEAAARPREEKGREVRQKEHRCSLIPEATRAEPRGDSFAEKSWQHQPRKTQIQTRFNETG